MTNVMLDLETWGTRPGCAIRSVGAVLFDPFEAGTGAEFYANVDDASCAAAKLHVDPGTVDWWSKQSQQARDSLTTDQVDVETVVKDFHKWFRQQHGLFVWSQGSNFDEVLWQAVARAVGLEVPWKFYNARDTRTAYDICGFNPRAMKRQGTYHNALDDAKHQALCVQSAYRKIYAGRPA